MSEPVGPGQLAAPLKEQPGARLASIDLVRGWVMVLMALDHVRDFFGDPRVMPENLAASSPFLFFTRWVTHFCAPTFVFLAGTAAFLYGAKAGRSKRELSLFLLTRGLWLVVLEVTVVSFGWWSTKAIDWTVLQVIAAIGVGMIALSALVHLPYRVLLVLALAIVCGHNLLDPIVAKDWGSMAWLWQLLHDGPRGGPTLVHGHIFHVQYPLLPWIGVIALGYAAGPLFRKREVREDARSRRSTLLMLGASVCLLFVLLRWTNLYGDPSPWAAQDTSLMTVASFLNLTKYPPSLLYLAMTLGPMFLMLACCERTPGRLGSALVVFGRVPLFYYLLHIYVIHLASGLLYWIRDGEFISPLTYMVPPFGKAIPAWYGNGNDLLTIYVAWIAIVLALYFPCRWYAGVKRRGKSALWSYL